MVRILFTEPMNYYKRHIGDYAAATRHLSILEHGVYCLLLDMYYTTEGPLPASSKEVCRKLGARSKDEVAAVESVLRDFFTPGDDGWRQGRCDAEIAEFKEFGEEAAARKANETDRQKRHRARRKDIFNTLRVRGIVPPWDASTENLQRLLADSGGVPDTPVTRDRPLTATLPETNCHAPATAITKNQEPLTINQYQSSSVVLEPPRHDPAGGDDGFAKPENQTRMPWPDGTAPGDAVTWASVFGDEFGVTISTAQQGQWGKFCPLAAAWIVAGVTVGQMRKAVDRARLEAVEPIAYLPAYADRVLASMVPRQARAPLAVVPIADPDSRSAIEAEGVAKGIGRWDELREHWPAYRDRVRGKAACFAPSLAAIVQQGLKA